MSHTGTVKMFDPIKGWGFVDCNGTDVYVHVADCLNGKPQQGDILSFDLGESPIRPGQMRASNVSGGSLPLNHEKGKGKGKGTGKTTGKGEPEVGGSGSLQGTIKSFNPSKGWGFIDVGGMDIFVHVKDCVDWGMPKTGDMVRFDLEDSKFRPGSKKATNVTGGSGWFDPNDWNAGKGKGKGGQSKGKGGYGPMWDDGWGGESWDWGADAAWSGADAAWDPSWSEGKGDASWGGKGDGSGAAADASWGAVADPSWSEWPSDGSWTEGKGEGAWAGGGGEDWTGGGKGDASWDASWGGPYGGDAGKGGGKW